jgi:hypothetical protein
MKKIAERNALRAAASLPLLDDRESARLKAAREHRVFEAVFAAERQRFSYQWANRNSWFSGYGKWIKVKQQIFGELRRGQHIEHLLKELGYRLVDDAWNSDGRRTFAYMEDAGRPFPIDLEINLLDYSWKKDPDRLRSFVNDEICELIEIEPSGPSGHLLHHRKAV